MPHMESILAIVRVLIVFGAILFAIRMKVSLGNAFVGVLLSPLHLCLLLSNEYFDTGLRQVYRHMWFPCLILLICGYIYFLILCGFS